MTPTLNRVAAIALLTLMFILAGGAAMRESPAVDEIAHVGAGLSYIQKFDLRLNQEHPPLSKVISGIPLALRGTHADYNSPVWRVSESVLRGYMLQFVFGDLIQGRWNDSRTVMAWARFPMLLLTLALGWMICLYATRLTNPSGGLLCLAVYCITPAFLVFGPLVINDVPVALFTFWALWRLGELWSDPTRRATLLFAVAMAAAMLTKFTGLILFAVIFALFIQTRFWPSMRQPVEKDARKLWRGLRWRAALKASLWALAIVYVFYFVFSWNMPDTALDLLGPDVWWAHVLRRLLLPVWLYVRGVLLMLALGSRPTFILGHGFSHGVPYYFPVIFVLKSPLAFLGLLVLAAVLWVALRRRTSVSLINDAVRPHWRVLMVGFFVYLTICLVSQLDISIRHFTIPMVLLILLLAPLPRMLEFFHRRRALQLLTAALVVGCYVAVVPEYPHFFPFVNSLARGQPLYHLMNDSNVDWNQSLPEVNAYARAKGLQPLKLDWLSLSDASLIVPGAQLWDCQAPSPAEAGQRVVVASVMILEESNCGWLERYPHESVAQGAMYAFDLPDPIPTPGTPGGPPAPADRKPFFGMPVDGRALLIQFERHPETIETEMNKLFEQYRRQQNQKKAQ